MKHSSVSKANECIDDAQNALRRFQMELDDIDHYFINGLQINGLTTFADYFFDGFIIDWTIHEKINDSFSSVSATKEKLSLVLVKLQAEKKNILNKINDIQTKRSEIIENA